MFILLKYNLTERKKKKKKKRRKTLSLTDIHYDPKWSFESQASHSQWI